MAFSHSCKILWFVSVIFVILPPFNLGLLSDYKICGDSECESPMSRVQAMRDHRGKDCRFLSFRRGDTILVYHKLTGKREDLWAGTIDKQFGYFPKDAVQEEQIYAAAEQVVETQKSDFICMDEHGYPIDSSHLDNSDEDGNDDQNIQNHESETIQTIAHTDDSSAEHPSASIDSPSESPDQPDATSREEDKNQKSGPTTSATHQDTHETPAALGEQGGSPSSSWLGSSVTGWLGLGNEEQSDNMPEREEPQEEVSLTSSVTGWLGFGGEKKLDDTVNSREEDKEVAASFTSTMSGWLGLGGEKEADHATKEQHKEREIEDASEPKETFRSRRMSLDLEGSQLQEEEKEVGTLGWLGKGLTSTLGFGATNLETDPIKEEKPTSSSWLDIGVGDILGFGKSESEVDESTRSNFKETEKDSTLGEATPSDQEDISESQPTQEEQKQTKPDVQRLEEKVGMKTSAKIGDNTISSSSSTDTDESNVEEHVVDHFSPLESASVTLTLEEDVNNDSIAVSDASEGKSPPVDAAATVDQKNVSPQTTSEENLQALDGTPPMTDEEGSAEATGEGHQLHKSTGNGSVNNNRELEAEENKSLTDDREIITEPDADLGSDCYSMASKGQYVENTDRAEHVEDDGVKVTKQVEREESTIVGIELGGNNDSHEKSDAESEKHHLDTYPTLTESDQISRDEGSRGQSQLSPSSDTHKEENEPTHSEEDSVTAHSVKTDNLDTVVTIEDSKREGESYNAGVQNRDVHSASGPGLYVNSPEDQMLIIDRKDPEPGSPENEEVIALKEKQEEFEEKSEVKDGERLQREEERKQTEDKIKEEEMKEEVHELQKTEKQEDVKKVEEEEGEMEDEDRNLDGKEELKNEEIQQEVDDVQEEMRQKERGEVGENAKHEVKELKEEEKGGDEEMVEVEGAKEGEKQNGQGESEKRENEQEAASVEEQRQHEVESVEEEKELMEVKEEEKQDNTKEFQVEENEAEVEEFRKGKEEKEQRDEERQQSMAGSKEVEEEQEKEIQKSKEELNKLNHSKEEGKETTVQVPHLETQKTNIHDILEPELEISEETHDDNTKTEENKREEEQVKHEETQQLADVEEDEESQKCSNKPCHQAPEDEPAGVRNENQRSTDDSMIQQNKQVLESETLSTESTETNRLREEEPHKASDDSDEGEETDITFNENTYSNNVNIADHNGLKVEQIGAAPHTDSDQHPAGEGVLSERTGTSLGETWETREHDHQAENDTVSQGPVGSGANNRVKVENESGGAFGLFKNAFSYFRQTPASKTKASTASTPSVDMNTASTPQAFLPVEQESDSTQFKPNSNQVPVQEIHKPPSASAPSPSPETKSLSKYYKNLLGHISVEELTYLLDLFGRNKLEFLDYILGSSGSQTDDPDNDESILSDIERLLHHHRETLATSQEVNENTKTLIALQKLEMLLKKLSKTFNTRKSDVSKATLQADSSCVGGSCSTNAKDEKEPKGIQDFSVAKDTKAQRDDWKAEERDKEQAGGVTKESRKDEVWKGRPKGTQTHPHIQPGSAQPQEGVMKQSLDFMRRIVTDSITYAHATREVLIGIAAQVRKAVFLKADYTDGKQM